MGFSTWPGSANHSYSAKILRNKFSGRKFPNPDGLLNPFYALEIMVVL